MSKKYEIQVLVTDETGGPATLADRCTIYADSLIGAADKYAAAFCRTGEHRVHEHRHDGQTLRHSHAGGDKEHGYFGHPEDGGRS